MYFVNRFANLINMFTNTHNADNSSGIILEPLESVMCISVMLLSPLGT